STEVVPVLVLAAAGWLAKRQPAAPSRRTLWLIALLLGAVPWAKLQAAPLAAALWFFVIWQELRAHRPSAWLPLLAGALLPTLAASHPTLAAARRVALGRRAHVGVVAPAAHDGRGDFYGVRSGAAARIPDLEPGHVWRD